MHSFPFLKRGILHGIWFGASVVTASDALLAQQTAVAERTTEVPATNVQLHRRITIMLDRVPLTDALRVIGRAGNLSFAYEPTVLSAERGAVTIHARDQEVQAVLDELFQRTVLDYTVAPNGQIAIVRKARGVVSGSGIIVGKVTDSENQPVRGATVQLDETHKGANTDDRGMFRIDGVAAGAHVLHVRLLGYVKAAKTLSVVDGETSSVDVTLEPSRNTLDQVVVTGTVVATEMKAIPNAMTVITAKQIEERGVTRIDQLFRGDVPGLFSANLGSGSFLNAVTMFSRGATTLSDAYGNTRSAGTKDGTNPIKTYVDGIELADPKYLSQIDPRNIERIEILTGPQASTIYGSNAINGVMQIFTKRGTTLTPRLTLNLLSGWIQNDFSSSLTPQHDYNAQLSGVEGRMSYNVGGSWSYTGPWSPPMRTTQLGGFGGARIDFTTPVGRLTGDATFRQTKTVNPEHGADRFQAQTAGTETGWYIDFGGTGLETPRVWTLSGQTIGLNVGYAPWSWWSHEFEVGRDVSQRDILYTAPGYRFHGDTMLYAEEDYTGRQSIKYATTARIPLTDLAQATITTGADAWQNLTSSWVVSTATLTGALAGDAGISRQPGHNTGGFLQTQIGIMDRLFLTYGLRAEWNPTYGSAAQPSYAPRYGVAYTQTIGNLTAKARGSYGRSTRPPGAGYSAAKTAVAGGWGTGILNDYGNVEWFLANAALAPEIQQGGEGGLELYLGTRGSLEITRYNQTVNHIIGTAFVDSVRSLLPFPTSYYSSRDANGYGYFPQIQNLNVGSIRNQGWELQGSVTVGALTTKGTYSWTKSRTIGVDPKYRALFDAITYPQYQPGATFAYLPEHTWHLGTTYSTANATFGVNVTGLGRTTNQLDEFFQRNLAPSIRLKSNVLNLGYGRGYMASNAGYALVDLTASRRISSRAEGVLQVQNLTDRYTNDYDGRLASIGRQTKIGLRIRL